MMQVLERIRSSLVGLGMPRALQALKHTMRCLKCGEISTLEAIDTLLAHEQDKRESRRATVGLKTSRRVPTKTIEGFDFAF